MGELERIHSHLLWMGVAGHEVGFDTFFMYTWRDRETVMDLLEVISGNRVNYGMEAFGGVRKDLDAEQIGRLLEGVAFLRKRTEYYLNLGSLGVDLGGPDCRGGPPSEGEGDRTRRCGAHGPGLGRGHRRSARRPPTRGSGDLIPFNIVVEPGVRRPRPVRPSGTKEIFESVTICEYILRKLPAGEKSGSRRPEKSRPAKW